MEFRLQPAGTLDASQNPATLRDSAAGRRDSKPGAWPGDFADSGILSPWKSDETTANEGAGARHLCRFMLRAN